MLFRNRAPFGEPVKPGQSSLMVGGRVLAPPCISIGPNAVDKAKRGASAEDVRPSVEVDVTEAGCRSWVGHRVRITVRIALQVCARRPSFPFPLPVSAQCVILRHRQKSRHPQPVCPSLLGPRSSIGTGRQSVSSLGEHGLVVPVDLDVGMAFSVRPPRFLLSWDGRC
jgi:hypothetical protein